MADKKFDLDEVKQQVKSKQKKENTNMKKPIIITVFATLIVAGALVAQAFYFYQLGADTERAVNNRVTSEVKSLTTTAKVEPSKQ